MKRLIRNSVIASSNITADTIMFTPTEVVDLLTQIEELKEYTRLHFSDEEAYMKEIGYVGLEAQQAAHIAFVDKLNQINLDEVDENQQDYLYELIDYLLSWLSTHILKMDKKIPVQ